MTHPDPASPSPDEWRLILALRAVTSAPLHESLWALIDDMLRFAAQPGCADAGVGGMPCVRMHVACDQCRLVSAALEAFKRPPAASFPGSSLAAIPPTDR